MTNEFCGTWTIDCMITKFDSTSNPYRTEYGGLADPLHELAKKPAKQQQQHDLRDEESFRWHGWGLIRRICGGTRRQHRAQPNDQGQCGPATGAQHLAHGVALVLRAHDQHGTQCVTQGSLASAEKPAPRRRGGYGCL
jgi:hypothetical protein